MIKNERQFEVTRSKLAKMKEALDLSRKRRSTLDSRLHTAMMEGMKSLIEELEGELAEYERLKRAGPRSVKIKTLEELPIALIRVRIARGLTQEQLARMLGLKPQQIQRYEMEDYSGVSFERLVRIAKVLGIDVRAIRVAPRAEVS